MGRKESEATEPLHTAQHRTPGSHASCSECIAVATRWRAQATGPSPTQLRSSPQVFLSGALIAKFLSLMGSSKGGGGKTAILQFFLSIQRSTMQELKGTRSREVVLLSNELNMMPYKHVAPAWKGNWGGEPYPRASAGSEILTKVISCLPRCLEPRGPPCPVAQTPIPLGGLESSPCLQIRKQRI